MPTIGEPLYVMKNIGPTPLIEDKQPPDVAHTRKAPSSNGPRPHKAGTTGTGPIGGRLRG